MSYRQKIRRLADACEIQIGYTARTRLEPVPSGGVPGVQLRDLEPGAEFDPGRVPMYQLSGSFDRYWAKPGDVLFRSRGEQNTAVVVTAESNGAAVVILPLLILRPDGKQIDPRYLAWFINLPATQRYFDSCARGTGLRMIPKPCLEDLEIAVPDLATQRLVVEIDRLARREQALTTALAAKKLDFTNLVLRQHVEGARRVPVD